MVQGGFCVSGVRSDQNGNGRGCQQATHDAIDQGSMFRLVAQLIKIQPKRGSAELGQQTDCQLDAYQRRECEKPAWPLGQISRAGVQSHHPGFRIRPAEHKGLAPVRQESGRHIIRACSRDRPGKIKHPAAPPRMPSIRTGPEAWCKIAAPPMAPSNSVDPKARVIARMQGRVRLSPERAATLMINRLFGPKLAELVRAKIRKEMKAAEERPAGSAVGKKSFIEGGTS